ncbi:MAG: glycogen synthase [Candidatus Nomurabacteria bacterium]|nr:MAG: glycogen synthase [Candidatus Nomurabacteria bacterium]
MSERILFISAEVTPLAKVGGLADVVGALPPALRKLGADARILMPKYGVIDEEKYPMEIRGQGIPVQIGQGTVYVDLWETKLPNTDTPVYLIGNDKFFGGSRIYFDASAFASQFVEFERFLFFAMSSVAVLDALEWKPTIIHCHDWHTGLIPALLKQEKPRIATVFTIHNLGNQGKWNTPDIFRFLGLQAQDRASFSLTDSQGNFNCLLQGVVNADAVNTVSPSYAKEILTAEYGEGLEKTLQQQGDRLMGILNGIDVERFDPSRNPDLPEHFSAEKLEGKIRAKEALQKECNLEVNKEVPLFSFIGRLTDQKGMDLIGQSVEHILKLGGQLVLLGSGMDEFEKIAQEAAAKYPGKVYTKIGFDAALAQRIYAGSDFFLMPSKYEPCGLGQIIAMRYGTIPVVRATGGLKDTVPDYTMNSAEGRGFAFTPYAASDLQDAITRAHQLYQNQTEFIQLQKRIMGIDLSWKQSARQYLDLYTRARQEQRP